MEYKKIPLDKIKANDYNPNELVGDMYDLLIDEIKKVGFLAPIIVRKEKDEYIIVDGEHRFNAFKQSSKDKEIPAIITTLSKEEAKIQTINLNRIKGEINPVKFAELLADLKTSFDIEDLEKRLKMSKAELENLDMLLDMADDFPDDLGADFDDKVPSIKFEFDSEEEKERILSLVLSTQLGWTKKGKPNTYLLSEAIDLWCEKNA